MEAYDFDRTKVYTDPYTLFEYKKEYNEDLENAPAWCEVSGILRKGEKRDAFLGNINHETFHVYKYIDTMFMKKAFGLSNVLDHDDYYLERMVEDLEDEGTYPIPATRKNFLRDNVTPEMMGNLSFKAGSVSMVSVAAFIAMCML